MVTGGTGLRGLDGLVMGMAEGSFNYWMAGVVVRGAGGRGGDAHGSNGDGVNDAEWWRDHEARCDGEHALAQRA